jgi:hypothetical protein
MYLANPTSSPATQAAMVSGSLGCITTPVQGNKVPAGAWWCADNGCFGKGYPGDEAWIGWLESRTADKSLCLFAVAPDVVGDAAATLARSAPWLPRIRALGYPAALAAQDGLEALTVPWDEVDVLFIGGTTGWKLGSDARRLIADAKARGKWVHMGRVNSQRRYTYARKIGCDSVDGTYLKFGPDTNLPNVMSWLRSAAQGDLFTEEHA